MEDAETRAAGEDRVKELVRSTRISGQLNLFDGDLALDEQDMERLRDRILADDGILATLKQIAVSQKGMGDKSIRALADIIKHAPKLGMLHLHNQDLSEDAVASLTGGLQGHQALAIVNFSHNCFASDKAGQTIGTWLESVPAMRVLYIKNCHFTDTDCADLAGSITKSRLNRLDLEDNMTTAKGVAYVADAIKETPSLSSAAFASSQLTPESCTVFADLLHSAPHLKKLCVRDTNIGDEGIQTLAKTLATNDTLTHLMLQHNGGTWEGAKNFMDHLFCNNSSLVSLLYDQGGDQSVLDAPLDAMYANPNGNIQYLSFQGGSTTPPLLEKNRKNAEKAAECLIAAQDDLTALSPQALLLLNNCKNGAFASTLLWDCDAVAMEKQYNQLIAALPGVPATREGWRVANETGFAPVDNPRVWRDPGLGGALAQVDFTPDFLDTPSAKGMSFRMGAALGLSGGEFVGLMNGHGLRIGAAELLDGDGQPNDLFQVMIDEGKAPALFAPPNLAGAQPGEMRKLMDCLPQDQQQRADTHQYRALLNRSAPAQTTNAARGR